VSIDDDEACDPPRWSRRLETATSCQRKEEMMNSNAHEETTSQESTPEPEVTPLHGGGDEDDSGGTKTHKSIPADDEEDYG
jgi:hypothetical protein